MIIDSHCHAWQFWPYQPSVPDPRSHSSINQLLSNMDKYQVDQALIVCANLDFNPLNNKYIFEQAKKFPKRIIQLADIDSYWSDTYHALGADTRLQQAIDQYELRGFTHYFAPDDSAMWLTSEYGLKFFEVAAANNQLISISIPLNILPSIIDIATKFPDTPILLHHMGLEIAPSNQRGSVEEILQNLKVVTSAANQSNIHLKMSGFHHIWPERADFPYSEMRFVTQDIFTAFGPHRLHWGSDSPVSKQHITYKESMDVFKMHLDFVSEDDLGLVFGNSLAQLIDRCGVSRN